MHAVARRYGVNVLLRAVDNHAHNLRRMRGGEGAQILRQRRAMTNAPAGSRRGGRDRRRSTDGDHDNHFSELHAFSCGFSCAPRVDETNTAPNGLQRTSRWIANPRTG
jgi:hypothetical protein